METDAAGLMQGCKKKCGNEDAFLLRDAMRKHGLCCGPVFVCPSRWWIVSRWLKMLSHFFLGPVAPSLYFFDPYADTPNSRGNPFSRAAKYKGG